MNAITDEQIIARFSETPVLVLGDVMLDEYLWGEVRRISPEAPVPVVDCKRRSYAAGGASNVATNVAGLGGMVWLSGVVGHDASAERLRHVLQEAGVRVEGLLTDTQRPTTTKTRIIAHSQQVVRVDSEERTPLSNTIMAEMLDWVQQVLPQVKVCVLSDYNKGVITPELAQAFFRLAQEQGKPTVVDPKGSNYAHYRGATVITPNVHEAEQVTKRTISGTPEVLAAAHELQELLGGTAILVTRGAEGMSLLEAGADPVHLPTMARSVYDVTGAGDTVVSALALALAAGAPLPQACRIANRAAGIVVGKLGTAQISVQELLDQHETPPSPVTAE